MKEQGFQQTWVNWDKKKLEMEIKDIILWAFFKFKVIKIKKKKRKNITDLQSN